MPPKIHKMKTKNEQKDKKNGDKSDLSLRDTVLVCVRMRPLNRKERKSHQKVAWQLDGQTITQCNMKNSGGLPPRSFSYDELWGPGITNTDIFAKIGYSVIKTTMEGYHGVVFAYGQTSSGKTYSIHGAEDDPGMIPRAVQAMFEYIDNTTDRDFVIQVSYMEIYNEVINDLLNPTGKGLAVREDPRKGVHVHNLKRETVMSTDQIYALLAQGESHRHIGSTNYNAVSSRSHTIFQVLVESQSNRNSDKVVLESKLNLVDLAGSEDTTKAGIEKKCETGNINKSLLALASVIWKISEPKNKQGHIPYRDSKLTRVLQDSLNGKACISVLCCMSPSSGNVDESISTLKFASRAKEIKNTAKKNEKQADSKTMIAKYKAEIEELKQMLLQQGDSKGGHVPANVAPSAVSPTELEKKIRQHGEEKQELLNKIAHLNKVILRSPFQGDLSHNQLLSGTTASREPNCRRPSYFNMGSRLGGSSAFSADSRRRQSAFTLGHTLQVMENPSTQQQKMPKRLIRSGSLGLTDETGNEEMDDLLCLPAKVQVHFEKQKTKKMEAQLNEKSGELEDLRSLIEEKEGIIQEKNHEINKLEEDIEDQRQEMKTKEYENETYLQTIREYEQAIQTYEEQANTEKISPEKPKIPEKTKRMSVQDIKSFKLMTGIKSRRTGNGSDSGPLIGFFLKNSTTGDFEYEGRTEWIKGFPDPVFTREFVVKNVPSLTMRFSAYDVDNEQQIDQGAFIGSTLIELSTLIKQFENSKDQFIEYELENDNNKNEKAWLRIKISPNMKSKKSKRKKRNRIQEIEDLKTQIEALKIENDELKKALKKS